MLVKVIPNSWDSALEKFMKFWLGMLFVLGRGPERPPTHSPTPWSVETYFISFLVPFPT